MINYGSATPEKNDPPPTSDNSAAATPDDAQPPTDFTLPPSASGDGTVSDSSSPTKSHSHRVTGIVTGVIFGVIILLALGYFFKRYRQKLTRCCTSKDGAPRKRDRGKKSQRLGSIDGLKPSPATVVGLRVKTRLARAISWSPKWHLRKRVRSIEPYRVCLPPRTRTLRREEVVKVLPGQTFT